MMINRRIFVQGAALVGTTPILANLLALTSEAQSREFSKPELMLGQHAGVHSTTNNALFKIDGWDRNDAGVDGTRPAPFDRGSGTSNDSQTVIRLTQSWRSAWR
jgi:phosphodiesterase/alkaline phosphatase D-like protein